MRSNNDICSENIYTIYGNFLLIIGILVGLRTKNNALHFPSMEPITSRTFKPECVAVSNTLFDRFLSRSILNLNTEMHS